MITLTFYGFVKHILFQRKMNHAKKRKKEMVQPEFDFLDHLLKARKTCIYVWTISTSLYNKLPFQPAKQVELENSKFTLFLEVN